MTDGSPSVHPSTEPDWLDRVLIDDARDDASSHYIADEGFTAKVMRELPAPNTEPSWRKPAAVLLWAAVGVGIATTVPGAALEVARETFRWIAGKPLALSEIVAVLAIAGAAMWTTAFVAWRRA